MRDIDPRLQAALDSGATTHCRCWRLERSDGTVLGFTDHDRTIAFAGTTYRADTGLDAAALQTSTGLSVDNSQAMGALSDSAITEEDIRAGRFDGAVVDQYLVDWRDPSIRLHLFHGTIGELRRTDTSFEAELRGPTEALNLPVGRTMQRSCDRVVGDAKCRVALDDPAFRFDGVVTAGAGSCIEVSEAGPFAPGWFTGGLLRWTDGRNMGLTSTVRADAVVGGRRLDLEFAPAFGIVVGDRFTVTAGCDKTPETCRAKFGNFLNFRGFPHIPGEDWLMAYPKSGEVHDGSTLGR